MTSPPSDQTILVTGATGFVAVQVIKTFLSAGYKVKGTVRSNSSADSCRNAIRKIFNNDNILDRLSFVIVKDIAAKDAFHDCMNENIHGVMHVAAPFAFKVEDNEKDLLLPSINGMLNMLRAVTDKGPNVKRVVATSSFAAVLSDFSENAVSDSTKTYDETVWNPTTYDQAKDPTCPGPIAYCASKALAERAAWDYMKENEGKLKFDLAVINPVFVFGPVEQPIKGMDKLNESARPVYAHMNGTLSEVMPTAFPIFCDVRDVALAHLKAFEIPTAGGERFIISSGLFFFEEVCQVLKNCPGIDAEKVPTPASDWKRPATYQVDSSKAERILGIKYTQLDECIKGTVASLLVKEAEFNNVTKPDEKHTHMKLKVAALAVRGAIHWKNETFGEHAWWDPNGEEEE